MPINKTSTTYSDEFITGTTNELNINVSDVLIATHNIYFENSIDAGQKSRYNIRMTTADRLGAFTLSGVSGYDGNANNVVLILNETFSDIIPFSQLNELVGREITTLNFQTNFTANVIGVKVKDSINGHIIILDYTSFLGDSRKNDGVVYVSGLIESCSIDYSLTGGNNLSDYSPALKIRSDGRSNANFYTPIKSLDASSATIVDIPFKYKGAYQTGGLTIQGKGIETDLNIGIYGRQKFELIHTIQAAPISLYKRSDDLEPQEFFVSPARLDSAFVFTDGDISTYKLNINLLQNPSDSRPSTYEFIQQSTDVNVFNNSLLGADTKYSFSNFSIVRTIDSEVSDVPLVKKKFTVTFDVDNTEDSPFSDLNTKVKVGIENIPPSWSNEEDYIQTFLSDSIVSTLGDAPASGTATGKASCISNYTATYNNATSITCSFDVEYNTDAQDSINLFQSLVFSIYVETQNHTLDYTDSDRVVLQPFIGLGIQDIAVDPIVVNNTQFITAPYSDFSTGIDASDIDGFPVQLLTASTEFYADWTDREGLRIDTISQQLVLKNTSTLEELELEEETIAVNSFPLIDSEYPNANYSKVKGYKIPQDEIRNNVEMSNVSDVSNIRTFNVKFPFFIRWEYYTQLILQNTPSSIIDNNEPFDGVNYDLNRIDDLADWELTYRVNFNCNDFGQPFEQSFDYTIPTTDYNEHPDVLSRVINSYKEDGITQLLEGSEKFIDSKENTLIVGEWTMDYTPSAISDFEIEFYIEAFENGSPTKIQRISSVNELLSSSWFSSTDGSGKVVKTIDGNKCVGSVYIDSDRLVNYDFYNVYGTFYNPKRPTENLLVESGDNFITEDGDDLIRDF